jgi:hypothetical protein
MRTQRYRVVLFEPGTGRKLSEHRILARSDQEAAECLSGTRLDRAGLMAQLSAQVASVDRPAQRQLFYAAPAWQGMAAAPDLTVVYAYSTRDPHNRLSIPFRLKATVAAIDALGGERLEGSAEVVSRHELNDQGEYVPNDGAGTGELLAPYRDMPAVLDARP